MNETQRLSEIQKYKVLYAHLIILCVNNKNNSSDQFIYTILAFTSLISDIMNWSKIVDTTKNFVYKKIGERLKNMYKMGET